MNRAQKIISYELLLSVLAYQTAIVRKDFETAEATLEMIPQEHYNKLAKFLEAQGLIEMALQVSIDPEHRFELAMSCHNLELVYTILSNSEDEDVDNESKWKQLGDAALHLQFNLTLAEECYVRANDLGGLLLLYSSLGKESGLDQLAKLAQKKGAFNIAFLSYFLRQKLDQCIELLATSNRIPEAAFFARTYKPSMISSILSQWKENLAKINQRAANALADPENYQTLFPNLSQAIHVDQLLEQIRNTQHLKAVDYLFHMNNRVDENGQVMDALHLYENGLLDNTETLKQQQQVAEQEQQQEEEEVTEEQEEEEVAEEQEETQKKQFNNKKKNQKNQKKKKLKKMLKNLLILVLIITKYNNKKKKMMMMLMLMHYLMMHQILMMMMMEKK